jgi:ketosteroid isomerase-like protein
MIGKALTRLPCFMLCAALAACGGSSKAESTATVKKLIQAQIDESTEATRTKDIDRYMSLIPEDWAVHDGKGGTFSREDLRRDQLEQWSIIESTVSIWRRIDRLEVRGSAATAWTSQRWERRMRQRTGPALDLVVTTQKHEEHWRLKGGKWWCYDVKELGGEILVNGKPYRE